MVSFQGSLKGSFIGPLKGILKGTLAGRRVVLGFKTPAPGAQEARSRQAP